MQALIEALISTITADAELGVIFSTTPSVYLTEAPESASLPLVILRIGAGQLNHDFSGDRITVVQVGLQVYAADIDAALASAERLGVLLDNATLALSTGNLLSCTQMTPIQPAMPGFNSLQNAIYTAALRLECHVFNPA